MVPPDSHRVSRAPRYSGYHYLPNLCPYGAVTRYGRSFQSVPVHHGSNSVVLQPPAGRDLRGLGCSGFARRYCRNHSCFLFLRLLRCFSSAGWPLSIPCLQHGGLPHSDIRGSTLVCSSPRLFAAYHVLHRLWKPRHPPYALLLLVRTLPLARQVPSRNPYL